MVVTILRGVSGAGKSTYTQRNFPDAVVASADHFFGHGEAYKFDPKKIGKAHEYSFETFKKAVDSKQPSIVVDNTNTQKWEFERYVKYAEQHGYTVNVVRLKVDPNVAASRNVHGVPYDTVMKMQNRFQDYPGEIVIG